MIMDDLLYTGGSFRPRSSSKQAYFTIYTIMHVLCSIFSAIFSQKFLAKAVFHCFFSFQCLLHLFFDAPLSIFSIVLTSMFHRS